MVLAAESTGLLLILFKRDIVCTSAQESVLSIYNKQPVYRTKIPAI